MKLPLHQIFNILFALLSVVLCIAAPDKQDIPFSQMVSVIYVVHTLIYFVTLDRKNWLGFEFFFSLAFFFINFSYPAFVYPVFPGFFDTFLFPINSDVVSRSTAIAYMGYAFLILGCGSFKLEEDRLSEKASFTIETYHVNVMFLSVFFFFALYIATGGLAAMKSVYADGGDLNKVGLYSYFKMLFTISGYLLAVFAFQLKGNSKWFYIFGLVVIMGLMLSTGSRTLSIGLGLIILVSFNNTVRRFRFFEILVLVVIAIAGLYFIMLTRAGDAIQEGFTTNLENTDMGWLSAVFDLIINNRNLYVLVDYADTHAYTWFQGMLVDITSPIPGFSSLLVAVTGEPIDLLHGGMLPTYLEFGSGSSYGLGTNMVGEAFRSFGYLGTAAIMFGIGSLVKLSYYHRKSNPYWCLLYYLLVSHSVMYGRSPILMDPRLITWALGLLYMVLKPVELTFGKKSIERTNISKS